MNGVNDAEQSENSEFFSLRATFDGIKTKSLFVQGQHMCASRDVRVASQ